MAFASCTRRTGAARRGLLAAFVAATAVGCGPTPDEPSTVETSNFDTALCTDLLYIDGKPWQGFTLHEPLDRPTTKLIIRAEDRPCNDVGVDGNPPTVGPTTTVTLYGIQGVPRRVALADPRSGDHIYTPYVHDDAPLPGQVQDLLEKGQ